MRIQELQIGDWANLTYTKRDGSIVSKNFKVTQLRSPMMEDPLDVWGAEGNMGHEHIKPIPLTPEVLEKNGWKEAQFWHEYQDGKNTIQACLPDMRGIINGVEVENFKCEYVHQYQHLLRLCGLEELADNFRV